MKWGDEKLPLHTGYVGLNDESGAVLFFNLVIPNTPDGEKKALELWNSFFQNTKELPGPLFIKAKGQEMHLGYTLVDIAGRKVKVLAEKRRSDKKVQFILMPLEGSNVEFKFEKASTGRMAMDWHKNEPLIKIDGVYVVDQGWLHYGMTTSVLIKEVEEFTPAPLIKKNVIVKRL